LRQILICQNLDLSTPDFKHPTNDISRAALGGFEVDLPSVVTASGTAAISTALFGFILKQR